MTRRRFTTRVKDGRVSIGREVHQREHIGDCFCGNPVYAAPGQSIVWLTRTSKAFGEVVKVEKFPTHKACRKSRGTI